VAHNRGKGGHVERCGGAPGPSLETVGLAELLRQMYNVFR
jgi:hypothetical protein